MRKSHHTSWFGNAIVRVLSYCTLFSVLAMPAVADEVAVLVVENAGAASADQMKAYDELIEHTSEKIHMVPIQGGTFIMGSPDDEAERKEDEGPQHEVKIDPFWMADTETTWNAYEVWMYDLDIQRRKIKKIDANERDKAADEYQISQPTEPYMNMDFGMGKKGYPAICMTQLAARTFCDWLSEKTGRYYRLPTEAEWEYACRAGTKTAYYWGDNVDDIDDHAWYFDNADDTYHKVGKKKANPWGLYDMHGNVSEWVLDQYDPSYYGKLGELAHNPLLIPTTIYPRIVRGGSYYDDPDVLRSAARVVSDADWKKQDPQIPKSIWYHTDATFVGFRIVRPLKQPSKEEIGQRWGKHEPVEDRKGGR